MIINSLSDSLIVTGTVAVNSKKHGVVSLTVTVDVPFDDSQPSGQPWLIPQEIGKVRDAAVALVQKTSNRDPKGMDETIKDALKAAAIKKDAETK